jgi:parvulin-like peptidyl-prolyl isomerase
MHRYAFFLLLMLLLIAGCDDSQKRLKESELERAAITQKIELAEDAGGLVLMVGGDTLNSDEVINSQAVLEGKVTTPMEYFKSLAQKVDLRLFKERAKEPLEQILMDNISNIVIYQYAKKQAGNNVDASLEQAAQGDYRRYVLRFGGNEIKADEELAKSGLDRKSFMERRKRQILIQMYVTSKLPFDRPITHRELLDYYDEMKDQYFAQIARIRFRLIDIQPDKLVITDPNQDRQQRAEELANRLLARIEGGEDFGALAQEYSHGPMRTFGGLWRPMQPTSLRAPYDILAAATEKIQSGQVAGPIITEGHVFIIKLEEKQAAGYESFENVQEQVRQKIVKDRQDEALKPLYARMKRQAKLGRTDEFIDFCLEKIYRMSRQQPGADTEDRNVNN